ncbi:lysylphosphatidylglycerol synthase transmembrane domain-containing protein [Clostridium estertheticum]|uniref:Phosphatidylglycerol lysyltransferase n=1 Tax=Clostridium estertheticum TaxID=238834 RepID=A0A7Y3SWP2_9CLOT|nr:lysylphosphatidylglycerol synthase transmembrane domain-containing protein [Clostridium estertheticum]MBW9172391.1 flippase-like domain-containing protein [Clostridium estertheticum]NNU76716.1 flippase-like domain-containing protein [Clostridium estertheticum]WBL45450.1 flippase-like domain-containing protein [Clostridium estertheticum]WLC73524.1 flippase-like domain-containing protein [Clostridium estertheticum]
MKNKILNIAAIIISLAIFIYFFLYKNGLHQLVSVLKVINISWIIAAIALMFIYWALEVFIVQGLSKLLFKQQKLRDSIKAAMVGQFYASITPLQTGAQPAIYYVLENEGIEPASASSILVMKFIIHQTTLTIYSFIIIILKYNYFISKISGIFYLCLVGFIFNFGIILTAVMFSINKRFTKALLLGGSKFLCRIKLLKNWQKSVNKIEKGLDDFHDNSILIAKNYKTVLRIVIINTAQLTVFYIIPYIIFRAFNLEYASLFNMLAAQTLVMLIVSITPLPGGAGGAEGGFVLLFTMFFKENILPGVLLWRIITYYSCILVGSLFAIRLPKNATCYKS